MCASAQHQLLVDAGLLHVAQVAQQGQRAELALAEQTLPRLALVGAGPESATSQVSGVASSPVDQPLPQRRLRLVARLGVGEEEHVAQLHRRRRGRTSPARTRRTCANAAASPFFTCAESGARPSLQ